MAPLRWSMSDLSGAAALRVARTPGDEEEEKRSGGESQQPGAPDGVGSRGVGGPGSAGRREGGDAGIEVAQSRGVWANGRSGRPVLSPAAGAVPGERAATLAGGYTPRTVVQVSEIEGLDERRDGPVLGRQVLDGTVLIARAAVMTMTGTSGYRRRSARTRPKPSRRGITTSVTRTSGTHVSARASASCPFAAVRTRSGSSARTSRRAPGGWRSLSAMSTTGAKSRAGALRTGPDGIGSSRDHRSSLERKM